MDAAKLKYNIAEIAQATGTDVKTLQTRRRQLVRAGELDQGVKGHREYTYEEVRKLIRKPRKPGEPRSDYIQALKAQLQTDGYTIKK